MEVNVQITQEEFKFALEELGHDPRLYSGQRVSVEEAAQLYELSEDVLLEAIETRVLRANYDFLDNKVWLAGLDLAHFYYCLKSTVALFAR